MIGFPFLDQMKREITYELKDQAFCYKILGVPNDICSLAAQLTKWLGEVETCKVIEFVSMLLVGLCFLVAIHFLICIH